MNESRKQGNNVQTFKCSHPLNGITQEVQFHAHFQELVERPGEVFRRPKCWRFASPREAEGVTRRTSSSQEKLERCCRGRPAGLYLWMIRYHSDPWGSWKIKDWNLHPDKQPVRPPDGQRPCHSSIYRPPQLSPLPEVHVQTSRVRSQRWSQRVTCRDGNSSVCWVKERADWFTCAPDDLIDNK